jgi:hypothetical protein
VSGAGRPGLEGLARLEEVGFDPRRDGGFGPDWRESSVRVCDSLGGSMGDVIWEAERAKWQLKDNTVGQRKLSHRALRSLPQSRRVELPAG